MSTTGVPVYKQQQKIVIDYIYDVIKQKHFDEIFLNDDNFISWLIKQEFNLEEWNGLISIPNKYYNNNNNNNNNLKYYLEQLWFRQCKDKINTFFLLPSICILDVIHCIKKRKNELLNLKKRRRKNMKNDNQPSIPLKRRKLNDGTKDIDPTIMIDPTMIIPDPPNFDFDDDDDDNDYDKDVEVEDDDNVCCTQTLCFVIFCIQKTRKCILCRKTIQDRSYQMIIITK